MTWGNRFRLLVGLVAVVVVAGLATNHLNQARGRAASSTAEVAAEAYTLGTPYSGQVLAQPVQVGQAVAAGDTLFVIDSAALRRDVAEDIVDARADTGDIDAEGNLLVRATEPGVLTEVLATPGAFVQAASELATVQREGSLHAVAQYDMTTSQYGRLRDEAPVTLHLPDGRTLSGTTQDVSVERAEDGSSRVVLDIASPELQQLAQEDRLVTTGTPLTAEVQLENDSVVSRVSATVGGWIDSATGGVTEALPWSGR